MFDEGIILSGDVESGKNTAFAQRLAQVVGRDGIVLRVDYIVAGFINKTPYCAGFYSCMMVDKWICVGKLSFDSNLAAAVYICPFASDKYRCQRCVTKSPTIFVTRLNDGSTVLIAPSPFFLS